jgi:hypothetical protein
MDLLAVNQRAAVGVADVPVAAQIMKDVTGNATDGSGDGTRTGQHTLISTNSQFALLLVARVGRANVRPTDALLGVANNCGAAIHLSIATIIATGFELSNQPRQNLKPRLVTLRAEFCWRFFDWIHRVANQLQGEMRAKIGTAEEY